MSSGGAQSLCILSTYPYHGYGVVGPVTGAPTGLWGDIKDPCPMASHGTSGGKGLNFSNIRCHLSVKFFGALPHGGAVHAFWMRSPLHVSWTRNDLGRASGNIFINMHVGHDSPYRRLRRHTSDAVCPSLPSASTTTAPGVACSGQRALRRPSRASANPTGQTEASARQTTSPTASTRCWLQQGTAKRNRSHAARLAAGGRSPATASHLSLPKGLGSTACQPRGTGMRSRSRRGRQVACREALGAWMAGSERDGSRVRDAAAYVERGCEEVDHRDPRRGVEPRCLAEAGGK